MDPLEQEILTFALMAIKTALADSRFKSANQVLTPQLNEITEALVAAGYGTQATT